MGKKSVASFVCFRYEEKSSLSLPGAAAGPGARLRLRPNRRDVYPSLDRGAALMISSTRRIISTASLADARAVDLTLKLS